MSQLKCQNNVGIRHCDKPEKEFRKYLRNSAGNVLTSSDELKKLARYGMT